MSNHAIEVDRGAFERVRTVEEPVPEPGAGQAVVRGAELDARLGAAWNRFADWADGWVQLQHAVGTEAVAAAYLELLAGHADPRHGQTCSLAGSD